MTGDFVEGKFKEGWHDESSQRADSIYSFLRGRWNTKVFSMTKGVDVRTTNFDLLSKFLANQDIKIKVEVCYGNDKVIRIKTPIESPLLNGGIYVWLEGDALESYLNN